jgi:hypothetical protein
VLAGSVSTNSVVAATKICINKTCVTEADLLRLLANASASGSSSGASSGSSSGSSAPNSTLVLLEGMTSNSYATPLGTFVAGGSATFQDANTYYGAFATGKWAPPALVPPTGAAGIANVVLRMPVATIVSAYTVGTGMTPGANPTAWILEGVAEGAGGGGGGYTTLDLRSGQTVDEKGTEYALAGNTKAFTTYRLSVTANGGHGATELHAVGFKFAVASATAAAASAAPATTLSSASNDRLTKGQKIVSPKGAYSLVVQDDNNIVVYGPNGPTWSAETNSSAIESLRMQADGNLVAYDTSGRAVWACCYGDLALKQQGSAARHVDHPGTTSGPYALAMQDDGNLVVYDKDAKVLWSSRG